MDSTLQAKLVSMTAGNPEVMSDDQLNALEALLNETNQTTSIRSIPNPRQIGTKDSYLCWIGAPVKPA
jgi:hypothetical protein